MDKKIVYTTEVGLNNPYLVHTTWFEHRNRCSQYVLVDADYIDQALRKVRYAYPGRDVESVEPVKIEQVDILKDQEEHIQNDTKRTIDER